MLKGVGSWVGYALCPLLTFFANELDPVRMVITIRPFRSQSHFFWLTLHYLFALTHNPPFPRKLISVHQLSQKGKGNCWYENALRNCVPLYDIEPNSHSLMVCRRDHEFQLLMMF